MLLTISTAHSQRQATEVFSSDNGDGTYTNPIIRGDFPDTDIIRVGSDYYMITSSFVCMPGIPVCHSRDLVHWRVIGHAYDSLTFRPQYSMEKAETAYGAGCWAPTMRYYKGWYYIGVNLNKDRFIMCKSRKPEGPYKMYVFKEQLYDPGLFIDDDGKKYIFHGKNDICVTELNDEGTEIKTPGDRGTVVLRSPAPYRLYFEGCHVYKRNGWYYVFNPSQGYNGFQMVSRSRSIYGPYETRVLLDDDLNYSRSGIHQGGFVDTPEGESWAFIFQDRDYMGRDCMLFPMRWVDDWPVVGLDPKPENIADSVKDRVGRLQEGKGVVTYRKPHIILKNAAAETFDSVFTCDFSGLQDVRTSPWEFSHVPIPEKWRLVDGKTFRIYASPAKGYEWARNSLTHKLVCPASTSVVKVDVSHLQEGDFAGNGIMGSSMLQQGVAMKDGRLRMEMHESHHSRDKLVKATALPTGVKTLWLSTEVTKRGTVKFSYSLDGMTFTPFGPETASGFWRFLGLRYSLCCYNNAVSHEDAFYTTENLRKAMSGYADFLSFTIKSTYHGNRYNAFSTVDFDLFDDKDGMTLVRPDDYAPVQFLNVDKDGAWLSFYNLLFPDTATKCRVELKARLSNAVIEVHEGGADGALIATLPIKATGGKWSCQTFKLNVPTGHHKLAFCCKGGIEQMILKNITFMKD